MWVLGLKCLKTNRILGYLIKEQSKEDFKDLDIFSEDFTIRAIKNNLDGFRLSLRDAKIFFVDHAITVPLSSLGLDPASFILIKCDPITGNELK